MRAYGGPEVLEWESVEAPELGAHEVRLRTIAAAVNRADCEIRSGKWPVQLDDPFPYVPGLEVLGEVVDCGAAVAGWQAGDRAITMMQRLGGIHGVRPGGYQETVVVAADVLAPVPADLDPLAVAALGLAAVTAWSGLSLLDLAPGSRLLVTGASGGVGSAAVRIGKTLGCEVTAAASGGHRRAYLESLGADGVVDLSRADAVEALGDGGFDAVLDTLGARLFGALVAALRRRGRLCLVGALTGPDLAFSAWDLIQGPMLTGWSSENLTGNDLRAAMAALLALQREGRLSPPPWRCFPMAEAGAVHRAMEGEGIEGRALLVP